MKKKNLTIKLSDIEKARNFLKTLIKPTPLLHNQWLSKYLGFECYLKLENMLPVGSFKLRGAAYKISQLSSVERKRGVICASAGNHAQGVAWASNKLGVKATIVMPLGASLVKIQNTRAFGAEVILHGNSYDDAFSEAIRLAKKNKKTYVHAFEDEDVVAGQGTVGLEILDQLPEVDAIIASIGGGGLLSGIAVAIKNLKPSVELYGCQAEGAPSMYQSFKQNKPITLEHIETFADGIAVRSAKPSMIKLLKPHLKSIVLANDEEIAQAMLTLLEKAKIVAEASAAISLVAAEKLKKKLKGKKVVIVICGGNVDVNVIGRVIDRGLIMSGRRIRVNVHIQDIPGALSRLTTVLASEGANILQAIHDRNELSTGLKETGVELTLETRGPEHSKKVLNALKSIVTRLDILH